VGFGFDGGNASWLWSLYELIVRPTLISNLNFFYINQKHSLRLVRSDEVKFLESNDIAWSACKFCHNNARPLTLVFI